MGPTSAKFYWQRDSRYISCYLGVLLLILRSLSSRFIRESGVDECQVRFPPLTLPRKTTSTAQ